MIPPMVRTDQRVLSLLSVPPPLLCWLPMGLKCLEHSGLPITWILASVPCRDGSRSERLMSTVLGYIRQIPHIRLQCRFLVGAAVVPQAAAWGRYFLSFYSTTFSPHYPHMFSNLFSFPAIILFISTTQLLILLIPCSLTPLLTLFLPTDSFPILAHLMLSRNSFPFFLASPHS